MRSVIFLVLVSINVLFGASATPGQQSESVQAIMAKVAQNQDQAQEIRSAFVYNQTLLLRFKRGDGKTCREELREFTVAPTSKGTLTRPSPDSWGSISRLASSSNTLNPGIITKVSIWTAI